MNHLLSLAMLLFTFTPQNHKLPDEFYKIPEAIRERATIIVSGTYDEPLTPCFWMPDGSRERFVDSMFDVTRVYRGQVGNSFLRVNTTNLPVNRYVTQKLKRQHNYLVLLRSVEEKIERLKTQQPLIFWDSLDDEEIIAIVELAKSSGR